jgi:glycosyltransferase involved in cell wall biosynthesis
MNHLTIIIPAKDEGAGIKRIINSIKIYSDDVIVVDANSKDGTMELCEELGVTYLIDDGRGKGAAMKIGVDKAKYEDILFFDADGSHNEKDVPEFIRLLKDTDFDMITASRRTGGSLDIDLSLGGFIRSTGCDFLVFLVNIRYKSKLTDVLYSFRAIRKNKWLTLDLKEPGFGIEQEMIMNALAQQFKIIEIPSREHRRAWGSSKLNTSQGLYFIWMILKKFLPFSK